MQVAEIWRYPVKSMAGEPLVQTELHIGGIPNDRSLYVVDERGRTTSARTKPLLLGHTATVDQDGSVLVDGLPWNSREVTVAVERAAGPGARIVHATGSERFDILPLLVATDGAIRAFGHDRRRLRPNIVLGGVSGLVERTWEGRQIEIGDAIVALADVRARCSVTTWDPDTLIQDVDVLRQIRSSFHGKLALNAWVGRTGTIRLGDSARILEAVLEVAAPEFGRFAR